ncbi:MAG: tyrosine-type recombinase/integrase [Rubellimicrobium sp.]|nr:tyrosine-type recombinase/integrase [Rubellimicrobium sp.]
MTPQANPADRIALHSIDWLVNTYLAHLEAMVRAGKCAPGTFKQRRLYYRKLCDFPATYGRAAGTRFGELHMDMPQEELIAFRDAHAATSGAADNMVKAVKALYRWASERRLTPSNPAIGIAAIHQNQGGARPWMVEDLHAFRAAHPPGSDAHMALTLFMFTAVRVSDAIRLGRDNESLRDGIPWLSWKPAKKGALSVSIPMLPQLFEATRASRVVGRTYLLSARGQPWASTDSFRNRFKDWCVAAGLPDLSPHGIRKAAGHLLAEAGATQHQIMVIHGHALASTSEIYTRGVARQKLARDAMALLGGIAW